MLGKEGLVVVQEALWKERVPGAFCIAIGTLRMCRASPPLHVHFRPASKRHPRAWLPISPTRSGASPPLACSRKVKHRQAPSNAMVFEKKHLKKQAQAALILGDVLNCLTRTEKTEYPISPTQL